MFLRFVLLAVALTASLLPAQVRQYKWVPGVFSPPVAIKKVDPQPAGVEGMVVLEVEVTPQGKPGNIRVTRSLGRGADEKAVDAVKQWKFKPAYKNGHPVDADLKIELNVR